MPLPPEILEHIPEEYRANETLNRFNDVGDLAKSYVELRSLQGRSIKIPSDDAGEQDRKEFLEKLINHAPQLMLKPDFAEGEQAQAFYRTLGRPEKPEGYQRPEGVDLNPDVEAELRQVLFDIGVSDKQFQKAMQAFAQREAQAKEAQASQIDQDTQALKGKWGVTFAERLKAAERINEQFYPGREFGRLTPHEIEALYNVHVSLTGKGPQAATQGGGEQQGMTPAEAKERAEEIMKRVHDPKSNLTHQEKLALINKRIDLLAKYAGYEKSIDSLRAPH